MTCNTNILNEIDEVEVAVSMQCDIQDLHKHVPYENSNLAICSQNIRSVYRNLDDLMLNLSELNHTVDIIILSECHLNQYKPIPQIDSYSTISTVNNVNQCDGVVAYVKTQLNAQAIEIKIEQATCIQIKLKNIVILGIYRSPSNCNAIDFINSLSNHLEKLTTFSNIIITGDININLIPKQHESNYEISNRSSYLNMLSSHGILPGHTLPTRQGSCLDHFMLKIQSQKSTAYVTILNTSVTDHLTLHLTLTYNKPNERTPRKKVTINYDSALKKLLEKNIDILLLSNDPYLVTIQLINKIRQSLDESKNTRPIPRSQRIIKPWMTPGLLRCIRNRNKLQLKSRREPHNEVLKITYKRYRNFCNDLIKKIRRKYEKEQLAKSSKNSKMLWQTIKRITNYKSDKTKNTDLLNTKSSPTSSVNYVNNYFAGIGKTLAEEILSTSNNRYLNVHAEKNLPDCTTSSLVFLNTDPQEIHCIVMGLRADSAPGWDNIPTKFLKHACTVVAPIISHLANLCFERGVFPAPLKQSIVTPVHKSGERDDVSNYRPISVLTAISKVIEKLINNRLISYLNKFSILSENQFGFRQSRSTEDAILSLTSLVTDKIDKGKKCLAIFLDLKKAFDTVSLSTLTQKMERIGIRGLPLKLLNDYLQGRTQRVKIGDFISNETDITYGVPQGSVLGPTLFLIYINDLTNLKLQRGHIGSYADDTAIVFDGESWESVFRSAESGLRRVAVWLRNNLLTLNASKTNYICFSKYDSSQPNVNLKLKIHMCNQDDPSPCVCIELEKVKFTKYLGVLLDQRLSWHMQLENVNNRIRKLNWIFKIFRYITTKELLNQLYITLAQPVMSYCITVWGGAAKTKFLEVERGQRCLLKVMYSKPYRFPTKELYEISDQLTIRKLYVLNTTLRLHKTLDFNSTIETRRRQNSVAPLSSYKSMFAKRQYKAQSAYIYNNINKLIHIHPLLLYKCKIELTKWLKQLSYDDTESLLYHVNY